MEPRSRLCHRPSALGNIDPAFETGTNQSPVNISGTVNGGGPSLQFRYPDNEVVVENTGHEIEVPIPAENGNTLKIGNSIYALQQYHFHAPASTPSTGCATTWRPISRTRTPPDKPRSSACS